MHKAANNVSKKSLQVGGPKKENHLEAMRVQVDGVATIITTFCVKKNKNIPVIRVSMQVNTEDLLCVNSTKSC